MVDVFGDVPFTEANKLKEGILYPKFDDDAAIYDALFPLIDEGIADLNNTTAANPNLPGTDDLIYGGNVAQMGKSCQHDKVEIVHADQESKKRIGRSKCLDLRGQPDQPNQRKLFYSLWSQWSNR